MTKNRSNYVDKIEVLKEGLKVIFSNKSEDTFPNIWLRDHAKDESNWDERTNQRKTFTAKLSPNIKIKNANISIISLQKGFGVDQIEANNFEKYLIKNGNDIKNVKYKNIT